MKRSAVHTSGWRAPVTQNRDLQENDVVVFEEGSRKSIEYMSDREFAEAFAPYTYLLVRLQDKIVLAGSVKGDCPGMLAEFERRDKNLSPRTAGRLVFWSGPKALELIANAAPSAAVCDKEGGE